MKEKRRRDRQEEVERSGQGWTLLAHLGQLKTGLVKSSVVPMTSQVYGIAKIEFKST